VSGASYIPIEEESDPAVVIAGARFGKELWKVFLLISLLFLLLEMAIAGTGKQSEAEAS
jgi:hypothetical protein